MLQPNSRSQPGKIPFRTFPIWTTLIIYRKAKQRFSAPLEFGLPVLNQNKIWCLGVTVWTLTAVCNLSLCRWRSSLAVSSWPSSVLWEKARHWWMSHQSIGSAGRKCSTNKLPWRRPSVSLQTSQCPPAPHLHLHLWTPPGHYPTGTNTLNWCSLLSVDTLCFSLALDVFFCTQPDNSLSVQAFTGARLGWAFCQVFIFLLPPCPSIHFWFYVLIFFSTYFWTSPLSLVPPLVLAHFSLFSLPHFLCSLRWFFRFFPLESAPFLWLSPSSRCLSPPVSLPYRYKGGVNVLQK